MIVKSFLRRPCAGGLVLLGAGAASSGSGSGIVIAPAGLPWGIGEPFILSALLMAYGLGGLAHDIGATNERDPWGRR